MVVLNKNASGIIEMAQRLIGSPYIYGAWGDKCTPQVRNKYLSYNPDHTAIATTCPVLRGSAKNCDDCGYNGKLGFDCRGFVRYCLKAGMILIEGQGATSQYETDKNWQQRGKIESMPNIVCAVYMAKDDGSGMKHTGIHIGDGDIIHCTGGKGVTTGSIHDSGWTHYAIPKGLYTEDEIKSAEVIGSMLMRGSKGDAVKALQEMLNECGYDCGTVDGKFGSKTEAAVIAFQRAEGLPETGVVDDTTQAVLAMRAAQVKPGIPDPVPGLGGLVSQVDGVKLRAALDRAQEALYDAAEAQENAAQMARNAAATLAELRDILAGVAADG